MAQRAYRKAPGTHWIIVLLCLVAIAGQIALVPLLGPRRLELFDLVYFAIPMVVTFIIGWITLRGIHQRRMERLARNLQTLGLQPSMKPKAEARVLLWNYVSSLERALDLRGCGTNIEWYATIDGHTDPLCLFEFRFVTGSGRYSAEHFRTVIAWICPVSPTPDQTPGDLPGFILAQLPWLERRISRESELSLPQHATLTKTWSPFGDASTAAQFLIPPVLDELNRAPKGECWFIGRGWFCCCFRNRLHPDDAASFVERSKHLLQWVSTEAEKNQPNQRSSSQTNLPQG